MTQRSEDREELRLLRRLSAKGSRLVPGEEGSWYVELVDQAPQSLQVAAAEALRGRGLVEPDGLDGFVLADAGVALLRRALSGGEDFAAQHQERVAATLREKDGARRVVVNQDESPLAWLRHRRGLGGRPHIDAVEYAAGERLRSDYARGQMMPRVTANWSATVAAGRRGIGGSAEITEVAIAARSRIERAMIAVGPEFGGMLVDFCCFLKGLEEIERERRWPARSAKVVLRMGLTALARHYVLTAKAQGPHGPARTRHWGSADYRPTID